MTLRILTDIYPPHIEPVRDGTYLIVTWENSWGAVEMESAVWDGHRWHSADGSIFAQNQRWRGLAFDPAAAVRHCRESDRFGGTFALGVFLPGAVLCK